MIVASSLGLIRHEILEQFLDPFRHNADVLHRLVGGSELQAALEIAK